MGNCRPGGYPQISIPEAAGPGYTKPIAAKEQSPTIGGNVWIGFSIWTIHDGSKIYRISPRLINGGARCDLYIQVRKPLAMVMSRPRI